MSDYNDDDFAQYAAEQERIAKEAASKKSGGTGGSSNFETVKWTGLVPDQMKLFRAVGGPPNSNIDKFTARTVRISTIVGDDGKKFRCILPEQADDPDFILWRIMNRVEAVQWVDKKKVFLIEAKNPDIYYQVTKNGFRTGDKQFMYDKGWKGQQKIVMNVIDRENMDWHKTNKHTMLLSKGISIGKGDGREFAEEGVPSFGFENHLATLFKYYKSWEKYDIGVVRTGLKETPYRIINACKYIEEVPEDMKKYVVETPLTEEEASWNRYDLSKLFGITTNTKIYNKLNLTIQRIDAALGTHFFNELKDAMEAEKAMWESEKKEASTQEEAPVVSTEPVRSSRVIASDKSFDVTLLTGWKLLSSANKEAITGVTVTDGKVTDIQYINDGSKLFKCPSCSIVSPETFQTCPACANVF